MTELVRFGLFFSILIITQGVPVPECCSFITLSGSCRLACEQISLVSIALNPQERQLRLWTVNQNCDRGLTSFWKCLNQSLEEIQVGEDWSGRSCCQLPQSQTCRLACLKARMKSDLFQECRRSDEIGFFSCVEQLEAGEKCCANAQTVGCRQACKQVFATRQIPNRKIQNAVSQSCAYHSSKVIRCVQAYTRTQPTNNPQKNLHCCEKSPNEDCREACVKALKTKKTDHEIVDAIEASCGAPALHDKMWQCFLLNADPQNTHSTPVSAINKIGMDSVKLQCCFRAMSFNCRRLCFQTFSNDWSNSRRSFDKQCYSDLYEPEMVACLTAVDEPCELGCEGLTYCTNFNDRPTELFQSCSLDSDRAARRTVEQWTQRFIEMPNMEIPVVDVMRCDANTWKAISCTLQLKPCKPHRSVAICRADCISILTKCLDYDRLPEEMSADSLCDLLAPSTDVNSCISLAPYLVKSPEVVHALQVTHPCHPNPCNESEVCVITRYCLPGQVCLPHKCFPGCRMGDISSLVVPQGELVSIPVNSYSFGCQKVCRCSEHFTIEDCVNGPCTEAQPCWDKSSRYDHGQVFQKGCNKCLCFNGKATCTNLACPSNNAFTAFTGLPCNCASHYIPVCGANGRTYPSICLAQCAHFHETQLNSGACYSIDPCLSNPCSSNQRCVPFRSVCISIDRKPCKQFECINLELDCAMLPAHPVCDMSNVTHQNLCYLIKSGSTLAYRGNCLVHCKNYGTVCGHNGETFNSECSAWADRVLVDYKGPCVAVGAVQGDNNYARCIRVQCPGLQVRGCSQVVPPGACCPICAGALEVLFSQRYADDLLSSILEQIRIRDIAENLARHVQTAECDLFAYLGIQGSLIVLVAPIIKPATSLQAQVCVKEAEKLAMLMEHGSPIFATDVLLSHLKTADILHTSKANCYVTLKSNFSITFFLLIVLIHISR